MSEIVTVVQARSSSTRLPGKVFLPLAGEPLLVRMVERVVSSRLAGQVVVATTTGQVDDAIVSLCESRGIEVFRGHPTNLLDRHYRCAREYAADVVVKIPSDCPLIDPDVIDRVIDCFLNNNVHFVSNLHPPTYPDGQDVEVMSIETLEQAWSAATKDFELEHTTPYIWDRPSEYKVLNVEWESGKNFSMTHRWTVDYMEDYEFIRSIYDALYPSHPNFSIEEILEFLGSNPRLQDVNQRYVGVNWYRHHIESLNTIDASQTKNI